MATVTAAEAKAHLAEYLRAAESGAQVVITRYGKPVAALVGASELEQLARLRAASPSSGLASLIGRWQDGDELADQLDDIVANRSASRPSQVFDE